VGDAAVDAKTATARSVEAFDEECGKGGLTCTFGPPRPCAPPAATRKCMEVKLVYEYKDFPLIPRLPLLAALLPDKLTSTSDVEVNS
jgi:hypothetical protein